MLTTGRRKLLAILPVWILAGCQSSPPSGDRIGLLRHPSKLTDALRNLRILAESDLIFGSEIFNKEFLHEYFSGDKIEIDRYDNNQGAIIRGLEIYAQHDASDMPAIHSAYIVFSRRDLKNGSERVIIKMGLDGRNSLTFSQTQQTIGRSLKEYSPKTMEDISPYQLPEPPPAADPHGYRFYECTLAGASGKRSVDVKFDSSGSVEYVIFDITGSLR